MAVQLSLQAVTKAFGTHPLFEAITFSVQEGDRLGIIGPNGSGKSTLLTIMSGALAPDAGERVCPRGFRVGHLNQVDTFATDATCTGAISAVLTDLPAHERDARIGIILGKGGFPNPEARVDTLSGGWRKRLSICRLLVQDFDLLLLDEPTNHLDLAGVRWLEDILRRHHGTVVLVSHDRWFLDRAVTRVIELDRRHPGGSFQAPGGYGDFVAAREVYLDGQRARQETLANRVRREEEWLSRQPKARTTKSVARIQRAGELRQELNQVSWRNNQNQKAAIDFSATGRRANAMISAEGLRIDRGGKTLLNDLDIDIGPGDCLGLLGPNGSGKSSLMMVLGGLLDSTAGKIRRLGGLRVVRFEQDRGRLDPNVTLRRTWCPNGDTIPFRNGSVHVVGWAKRFLFRTEQLDLPVGKLSGGEQARLLISLLVREPADVLLLDEPTNDLDIPALEVLEEAILDFPGAVMLVTHDRWLLDRVGSRMLALDGKGGHTWVDEYAAWEKAQHEQQPSAKSASTRPRKAATTITTTERRELERMEATIAKAEATITAIDAELASPAIQSDGKALEDACERLAKAQEHLDDCYTRWGELEAKNSA